MLLQMEDMPRLNLQIIGKMMLQGEILQLTQFILMLKETYLIRIVVKKT